MIRLAILAVLAVFAVYSIVVLHNVIVAEQGRHEELLALGGIYAALFVTHNASAPEVSILQPNEPGRVDLAWRAH
jgi:hypothetical protein